MGLSFWLFSRMNSLWNFYAIFMLLSLGLTLASGVVTMTAVAGWFRKKTSLAMGILTSGFGASGLLVPAVVWLVDRMDWRRSLSAFGIFGILLGLPLSLLVKKPPLEDNTSPTVEKPAEEKALHVSEKSLSKSAGNSDNIRTRDILKSRNFWFLSLAVMFGGLAGSAVMVHQIPYMTSVGISRQTAGFLVGVMSVADVTGRLGFGWLGDKFDKRLCFVVGTVVKTIGVLIYAFSTSPGLFVPAMIIGGIGFGGLVPLRPAMQIEFFGMKSFALIQGLLMTFLTVGAIVAPPFAGWIYDTVGDYRIAFIILGVLTLAAAPLIMAVKKVSPSVS